MDARDRSDDGGLHDLIEAAVEEAVEEGRMVGKKFGKYRVVSELGRGGMGETYLAEDVDLGRKVVIKAILFHSQDAESRRMMVNRFRREAQSASRVNHENVVRVYDFIEEAGRHLLIMEYVEAGTLRDALEKSGPMPVERAIRIAAEILKGLEAIHASKIVHRDLKPANVMLLPDDRVKILDFGLGKSFEATGDLAMDMTLTQQGAPIGSPMYMSPEQINSMPDIDLRSDLYSAGVMLYQMLAGFAPFRGRDPVSIYDKHRRDPVPELPPVAGRVSAGVKAVIRKAMAKRAADRYLSAEEMRRALEALVAPPQAKASGGSLPILVSGLALVVMLGLLAFVATGRTRPSRASAPKTATPTAAVTVSAPKPKPHAAAAIEIPPPPPEPVLTTAAGCTAYETGATGDALEILSKVVAKTPDDAEALFCLCGAEARQPDVGDGGRKTCQSFLRSPKRDRKKDALVRIWLKR